MQAEGRGGSRIGVPMPISSVIGRRELVHRLVSVLWEHGWRAGVLSSADLEGLLDQPHLEGQVGVGVELLLTDSVPKHDPGAADTLREVFVR